MTGSVIRWWQKLLETLYIPSNSKLFTGLPVRGYFVTWIRNKFIGPCVLVVSYFEARVFLPWTKNISSVRVRTRRNPNGFGQVLKRKFKPSYEQTFRRMRKRKIKRQGEKRTAHTLWLIRRFLFSFFKTRKRTRDILRCRGFLAGFLSSTSLSIY